MPVAASGMKLNGKKRNTKIVMEKKLYFYFNCKIIKWK